MFTIIQWTWGILQTLAGSIIYLYYRGKNDKGSVQGAEARIQDPGAGIFKYRGACVTVWDNPDSLSLGKFIFLTNDPVATCRSQGISCDPEAAAERLLRHEYGHSVQSVILGPFYLLLVGAPSFLWGRIPYFERMRRNRNVSYYKPVFEHTADILGGVDFHRKNT